MFTDQQVITMLWIALAAVFIVHITHRWASKKHIAVLLADRHQINATLADAERWLASREESSMLLEWLNIKLGIYTYGRPRELVIPPRPGSKQNAVGISDLRAEMERMDKTKWVPKFQRLDPDKICVIRNQWRDGFDFDLLMAEGVNAAAAGKVLTVVTVRMKAPGPDMDREVVIRDQERIVELSVEGTVVWPPHKATNTAG